MSACVYVYVYMCILLVCVHVLFIGADITDYFNYGFSEETWRLYCEKQRKMRYEVAQLNKIAVSLPLSVIPAEHLWFEYSTSISCRTDGTSGSLAVCSLITLFANVFVFVFVFTNNVLNSAVVFKLKMLCAPTNTCVCVYYPTCVLCLFFCCFFANKISQGLISADQAQRLRFVSVWCVCVCVCVYVIVKGPLSTTAFLPVSVTFQCLSVKIADQNIKQDTFKCTNGQSNSYRHENNKMTNLLIFSSVCNVYLLCCTFFYIKLYMYIQLLVHS